MEKKELTDKINKLKKEKNAIVLAHTYQNIEIDEVADFSGDSLYLSRQAAKTDADIIVFAGVYFMAETAKILSPNKTVLLPNIKAGCDMADKINLKQLREFKAKYPDIPVVCYVNSTAEVKSESDICCTSANAVNVVKKQVTQLADFVGSTTAIIKFVKESKDKEFIIVTEQGVVQRLERDCPDKKFILINEKAVCDSMKLLHLEDIYNSLKNNEFEINVDETIAKKARTSIDRMIKVNA